MFSAYYIIISNHSQYFIILKYFLKIKSNEGKLGIVIFIGEPNK